MDEILERDLDQFTVSAIESMPLADFAAGWTIPARHVERGLEAHVLNTDQVEPVHLVAHRSRFAPGTGPAAWILNDVLYLFGTDNDWTWAAELEFFYVAPLTELTSVADAVPLFPDRARPVFAAHAAQTMTARAQQDSNAPPDLRYFVGLFEDRKAAFLNSYSRRAKARVAYVRESW